MIVLIEVEYRRSVGRFEEALIARLWSETCVRSCSNVLRFHRGKQTSYLAGQANTVSCHCYTALRQNTSPKPQIEHGPRIALWGIYKISFACPPG